MRIAIDVTASIYQGTGVASYYNNLIPKLLQLGKEQEFITFGYSLRRRGELKLAKKKYPFPPKLMEIIWNRLHVFPVEMLVGKCDVVHSWDYIQPATKKARLVTTIHDLTPIKFPQYQHPRTIASYKAGLRWVKKEAAAIIADSEATKKDITEILGIDEKRIHVVYLAAANSFQEFRQQSEPQKESSIVKVRAKYGLENEYLLYLGTQEPRKNLENVIKAYQLLKIETPLVIAGNFGWGEKLKPIEGVKLIGFVDEADLPALYSGATCFIYPSLYEGFGLPVLEAMAAGCPVVTSNRGSLAEVGGEAVVQANPENIEAITFGIMSALNNKSWLVEKGIQQSKKFSWEKTATETLKVYESACMRRRKAEKTKKNAHLYGKNKKA